MRTPASKGFFGPGSVTWRIHSHPTMLVGGLRALLVQALNPLAMAAVAQHSNYKDDPWARLMGTSRYLVQTTFGDETTARAAAARVRGIHRHVHGVDDVTGRPYRADDPELLLWVHAAEVHSFLTAYRRYGPGVSDDDANRYVEEMVRAAELIGLSREDVPHDLDALRDYLRGEELLVTPAAMEAMRMVLVPPVPLPGGKLPEVPGARLLIVPGRMVWSVPAAAAVAILPERVRTLYGLPRLRPAQPLLKPMLWALLNAMRITLPPPGLDETLADAS